MRRNIQIQAVRITRAASFVAAIVGLTLAPITAPALAQVRTVDPNTSIDADLAPLPDNRTPPADIPPADPNIYDSGSASPPPQQPQTATGQPVTAATPPAAPDSSTSYKQDDLIGAAEGVFGKGAEGLAGIIEKILKEQGEPNAYIAGREASGALVVGLRYGSGTLNHKIEGKRDVYWTGPSIGFDAGGNAGNTFVLVYNLYDTQDIYKRFPAGEGAAYFVGGFHASYLRRGDIVLIPIRLGVGYRLGVNAGYMKFTEKRNWVPF
ncbi:MAG: DUF1134 domain-containing protein [Sphingobium phenoxybenzoativorans]